MKNGKIPSLPKNDFMLFPQRLANKITKKQRDKKMKKTKVNKYYLSLASEYRVASELLKQNLNATVTFGNAKSADVVAYGLNRKAKIIEVKTSQQKNFVTSFYNKYKNPAQEHPDFWVLVQVRTDPDYNLTERFFILSHDELSVVQAERNQAYWIKRGFITKDKLLTWEDHYRLITEKRGVDDVLLTDVEKFENKWDKIIKACNR
jgi:hypothetical protein